VVIISKLDRLTRSVRDLADLLDRFEKRGVALVSVAESLDTGTAAGRLVLNLMASVSQWEREVIGERTRDAMRHKKAQHQRVGTLPYGYALAEDGAALAQNATEMTILARIRDLVAAGQSLRKIASRLNAEGFRTRTGREWGWTGVRHLARTALSKTRESLAA
jgi:site-specific DNA recombinase